MMLRAGSGIGRATLSRCRPTSKMPPTTTKQMVKLEEGAAKTSEPSNAMATTMPSMNHCSAAA